MTNGCLFYGVVSASLLLALALTTAATNEVHRTKTADDALVYTELLRLKVRERTGRFPV